MSVNIFSLKYRIALIVFLLELVMLTFVLQKTLGFIENSITEDFKNRQDIFLNTMAFAATEALFTEEFDSLQREVELITKSSEIEFIQIFRDDNIVLAHSDFMRVGGGVTHPAKHDEFVMGKKIDGLGTVEIVFNDHQHQERIAKAKKLGITIAITGILIILVASLVFGRSTSWVIPEDQALEAVPKEREEELKREIARGREEITREILTKAQKIIPQYGIELVDVRIKRLDYVESVRQKVYERMISERKRIAAQFRSEGEGRSAEILGEMEKELRNIRSMAYRTVQEIQGRGDAEATRIYGRAYNEDPEFYAFLRTLESYREGNHEGSTLVLTTDSDFYRYLKEAAPR